MCSCLRKNKEEIHENCTVSNQRICVGKGRVVQLILLSIHKLRWNFQDKKGAAAVTIINFAHYIPPTNMT